MFINIDVSIFLRCKKIFVCLTARDPCDRIFTDRWRTMETVVRAGT